MEFIMSKDPPLMVFNHLKKALPDRGKEWIYFHELPSGWNPNHGLAVVVAEDLTTTDETSYDRVLVRVAVHGPTLNGARKLGRQIHQYLLSPMGGFGLGISRTRSSGVIVGPDSLAGGYVATASFSCGTSKALF